jgi:hypothetical protein
MLDSETVRNTIAALRNEGWHYEHDLLTSVHSYQVGDVVTTLQVLMLAGCVRPSGEGEKKRYKWIGK